ncbi:helix-turn-helix domain-containing protein [Stutzerimonas nitrititolerans]|uniref:helix-turn-helix domain-containing protein n=1 Tax=Stutzerimonas nitrititolerans TaxID=2482751 RepID=UPI0035E3D91D
MSGGALTATELADIAGVTRQTISFHLAKLHDAGLLEVERQGRHRYYRLAGPDVAQILESLMGMAPGADETRPRIGPRDPRAAQGAYLLRPPRRGAGRAGIRADAPTRRVREAPGRAMAHGAWAGVVQATGDRSG